MSTQPGMYVFFSLWVLTLACFGGILAHYQAFYPFLTLGLLTFVYLRHSSITLNRATLALMGLVLLLMFQLVPLPSFVLKVFSTFKYDRSVGLLDSVSYFDARHVPFYPITDSVAATRSTLYMLLGFSSLWISTVILSGASRKTLERAMFIFIAGSLFIAILGTVHLFSGSPKLLWLFSKGYLFFGPFVNRNHAGGLLAVSAVCSLSLAFSHSLKRHRFFFITAYFIFFLAMTFISSRAALLSTCLFSAAAIYIFQTKQTVQLKKIALVFGVSILFIFVLSIFWKAAILHRIYQHKEFRFSFWTYALSLWAKSPWLGTGAGTFSGLSPQFVGNTAWVHPEHVENDYLEILANCGLLGAGLTLTFLLPLFRQSFLLLGERSASTLSKAFALGFLTFCFHAFFVFHLPLPASHFLFCFLSLGLLSKINPTKILQPIFQRTLIGLGALMSIFIFYLEHARARPLEPMMNLSSFSSANLKALSYLHEDLYEVAKENFIKSPDTASIYQLAFLEHQFGDPKKAIILAREYLRREPLKLDHRLKLISYFGEHGFATDAEKWALDHLGGSTPSSLEFAGRLFAELSLFYLQINPEKSQHYLNLALAQSKNEWNIRLYEELLNKNAPKALSESWKFYRNKYTDPLLWDLKWLSLSKKFPEITTQEAISALAPLRPDFLKFWKKNEWFTLWPSLYDSTQPLVTLPIHIQAPPRLSSYRLRMILKTRQKPTLGLVVTSGTRRFVSEEPPVSLGGGRFALYHSNFQNMIDGISFSPFDKSGEYAIESIEIFVNSQS